MDLCKYDLLWRYTYKLECRLARFADLIIANSHAGKNYAIERGFPRDIKVIHNGVDVERFTPNISARQEIRAAWQVADHDLLIGFVGRLDPMKDPHTFLAAASIVGAKCGNSKFVIVGNGLVADVPSLRAATKKCRLENRIIWAGSRNDMPAVYNSLDLLVSSSCGEGFSNAIAEAMACAVPCVVTDVGDSARIVGETGVVVPPQNPGALAQGIVAMLARAEFNDGTLKIACRKRIVDNYGIERLIGETTTVLNELRCPE